MEQARPVENLLAHRSMRIFIMFVPRRYGGSNMMHRSAPPVVAALGKDCAGAWRLTA